MKKVLRFFILKKKKNFNFYLFFAKIGQYRLSNPENFRYLKQSGCTKVSGIDDSEDFKHTKRAMNIIGIPESTQSNVFKLLAAILHLGNLEFKAGKGKDSSEVSSSQSDLDFCASLLGTQFGMLVSALTSRTVSTGGNRSSTYSVPLNTEQVKKNFEML